MSVRRLSSTAVRWLPVRPLLGASSLLLVAGLGLAGCQELDPSTSSPAGAVVQSTGETIGTLPGPSTTVTVSADAEAAAVQEAVRHELRVILAAGESGDFVVEDVEVNVSLLRDGWAAAWFPGPPGYEDGYCVLSKETGVWVVVFGIEHHWWSGEAELIDSLLYAGVPEDFALELAGMAW